MSLREQQRAMTRERIITALGELIETKHPLEVTMAAWPHRPGCRSRPSIATSQPNGTCSRPSVRNCSPR